MDTGEISFDISWENSWRASWSEFGGALQIENWDAAWGDTSRKNLTGFQGEDGGGTETATPVDANSNFRAPGQPVRVGIFAREATTRRQAGGGYYSNMELSGNVMERTISEDSSGCGSLQHRIHKVGYGAGVGFVLRLFLVLAHAPGRFRFDRQLVIGGFDLW